VGDSLLSQTTHRELTIAAHDFNLTITYYHFDQVGSDTARQLLGMKGAAETDDIWKIRVQLMKPVTWIPLIWGE